MKKSLRKEILARRNRLAREEIIHLSQQIIGNFKNTPLYRDAYHIMLYLSFASEVVTQDIVEDLLKQKKHVYIPLTVPKSREMIVSKLKDPEKDLEEGNFGVLEPRKGAVRPTDTNILDLIIVPGLLFDKRGYRIGYGGGYYDRFLPKLSPKTTSLSLAFDFQILEEIPNDPHDYPVQYIISEKQFIKCQDKF